MSKTNPNKKLTLQALAKIKRKNKWLMIIGLLILGCSIVSLICIICFLNN